MSLNTRAILGLSLLLCCLYACKKNNDAHPSSGNSATGTLSFSISLGSGIELIVSETGGKILMDTVLANNGTISAILQTNDTLVDVTTVDSIGGAGGPPDYLAFTYKAVNLARWQTPGPGNYNVPLGPLPPHTTANLTYINAYLGTPSAEDPYFFNSLLFSDAPINESVQMASYSAGAYYEPGTINYQYYQYGSNPDYILIESSGQYKFHTHVTNNDTVDLSEMETGATVTFSRPAEYTTIGSCSLVGYWDTTNYFNSTLLYSLIPGQPNNAIADVEYPTEKCQTYELNVSLSNSNNDDVSYYSYGNAVPSTLSLPDESAYNLSSSTSSLFSVNFTAPKPTFYETLWTEGNVYWTYYAPPDSTTLHPLSTLTALNSKLLQGQNLSSIALNSFTFGIAQGMGYLPYYEYLTNPALLKVKRLPSMINFTKNF